ncbi:DUF4275 family protein [Ammoniphilus sp. YIM 78166]|uniref:DUF4275 family protein n=1 Tax=Ammoniphilus sp. YIM 78166 TaxID=1644106 RepID=UPI00106FD113|nr:DUF4275 family protein [Ammoniphilus sp. YIM 78166]
MDIVHCLSNKKVRVKEIPKWGAYLRKQWEDQFASHMSYEEKKSIYLFDHGGACGYLWHLFSYGKKDCLKEGNAEEAFNLEPKNTCYVFYQHSDDALILENALLLAADDLTNETDIYVVDKEFTWTYVKTHETGWCGPYFSWKSGRL